MSGSPVRILLVEDEPALLQLIQRYLQRLGFQIEAHTSSLEALQSFQAAPDRYSLIVADLGLPDMAGETLLSRMLKLRPGLCIVICSGSPFFIESLPVEFRSQVTFLQKPFMPKMLGDAVQTVLKEGC